MMKVVVIMVMMAVVAIMITMIPMAVVAMTTVMRPVMKTAMMITQKDGDCFFHVDTHDDDTHMYSQEAVDLHPPQENYVRKHCDSTMIPLGWKPLTSAWQRNRLSR